MEVGGTGAELDYGVGSNIVAVEEDTEDGAALRVEGLGDLGGDVGAVALGLGFYLVCMVREVPTLKLPSWISGLALAQ